MKLGDLLAGVPGARVAFGTGAGEAREFGEVRDDSRKVTPGDVFVAVPGAAADGRAFVADAVARGAAAVVVEGAAATPLPATVTRVTVPSAREAVALMAANRFPLGRRLTLTAVTGTNGKTTSIHLMEAILNAAGRRTGVVGTIAYRFGAGPKAGIDIAAPLTTPGPLAMHALFADMADLGATDVVLEASSHALDQSRLAGCLFRVAAMTNLTQDHLDYHQTMERYFDAKALLFERLLDPAGGVAVLPFDRPEGQAMRARVQGTVLGVSSAHALDGGAGGATGGSTGAPTGADVVVDSVRFGPDGFHARVATPIGVLEVDSALVGEYNLANVTLAIGMGVAHGLSGDAIVAGIRTLAGVSGRLEPVANERGVLCLVDYAHTPDALERALAATRPLVDATRGGRLLVVFGCGGDRDRGKRPLMGRAATRDGDVAIVTSDNPRTEDPATIVADILTGIDATALPELSEADLARAARGFHVVVDRRTAIQRAVAASRPGDVLLIAGKGHEDYQIIGTTKHHFDDREEAAAAFAATASREVGGESAGRKS